MKHSSGSRSSVLWQEDRRLRITSSNVGTISRHCSTTKVGPLVHQLLYSNFKGNRAILWGLLQDDTEKQYREYINQCPPDSTVTGDCGLIVSTTHPWLAATPDGFVHDPNCTPQNELVEYKNPHTCRGETIEDAMANKKIKFLTVDNGSVILKRSHPYYYQVQTATLCSRTQWCDFVVRTSVDFRVVERVCFDDSFYDSLSKVRHFYFNSVLPELTKKHTPICEPEWINNSTEWNQRIAELTGTDT